MFRRSRCVKSQFELLFNNRLFDNRLRLLFDDRFSGWNGRNGRNRRRFDGRSRRSFRNGGFLRRRSRGLRFFMGGAVPWFG